MITIIYTVVYYIHIFYFRSVIEAGQTPSQLINIRDIQYIEDSNATHDFDIEAPHCEQSVRYLKLTFYQSTDFYGRITIYSLKVFGNVDKVL